MAAVTYMRFDDERKAMTLDDLLAVGFSVSSGQLDYRNVNYGHMTPNGPWLTEAGHALYKQLSSGQVPAAAPAPAKRGRPPKLAAPDTDKDTAALLDELLGSDSVQ